MNKEQILLDALNESGNFNDVRDEFNVDQLDSIYTAMDTVNNLNLLLADWCGQFSTTLNRSTNVVLIIFREGFKMRNKIKEHYQKSFSSSPIEVSESEIDFIIKSECKCDRCSKSIFEMWDFPELLIKDDELRCEECYGEDYRPICPVCENSYDIYDGESEYSVVIEEDSNDYNQEPGIYHNDKLVLPIRINFYKSIDVGGRYCEVYSDKICPECVEKMLRKSNYLKSEGIPCILLKRYENDDLFKEYTPERMRLSRQKLIHQRITCRGLIERGNHIADYGKSGRAKLLNRSSSQNVEPKNECSTCS